MRAEGLRETRWRLSQGFRGRDGSARVLTGRPTWPGPVGGGGAGEPAWLGPGQSGSPWQARPVFLLSQSVERRTEQAAHAPAPGHPGGPRTLRAVPEAGPGTRRLHTGLLPGARPPGAHHGRSSEPSQPPPCLCCAGVIGPHGHLGNPPPPLHPPCQRSYGELLRRPPWVAESYPVPVACLATEQEHWRRSKSKTAPPAPVRGALPVHREL